MDADGEAEAVQQQGPEAPPPVLIGTSGDVGWKYGKYCDPTNKSKIKCNFCGHISTGGIFRFKQHVADLENCVRGCKKSTPEAIADVKKHFQHIEETKSRKRQHEQDLRDDVHITSATTQGTAREDVCVGSSSSEPNKLGPMDRYVRPIDGKSSKDEALRQLSMNEALFIL